MPSSPRVSIFPDAAAAGRALAGRVARVVQSNARTVLGLPTGRTPLHMYAELRRLYAEGQVDFSRVTTFNLDEFLGIPASHPGSYWSFMQEHLFAHVNADPDRTHFLDGMAADPDAECDRYEAAIAAAGGIDLQILGIGTNGHIGFNEPADVLYVRTHRVTLRPETRQSNAALFGREAARVPAEALSMGMGTILHARSLVLLATGASKAACVQRVVNGEITTQLPASCLQLHDDVELVLDEAAASGLQVLKGARGC